MKKVRQQKHKVICNNTLRYTQLKYAESLNCTTASVTAVIVMVVGTAVEAHSGTYEQINT